LFLVTLSAILAERDSMVVAIISLTFANAMESPLS
jgi:hypothetical protein